MLFVIQRSARKEPDGAVGISSSRDFSGANLLTLFLYAALGGHDVLFHAQPHSVQGIRATAAGASLLPFVVIMFSLSRWSGGLIDRLARVCPLIVGPIIAGLGSRYSRCPQLIQTYWTSFFPAVVVLGFGMAITVAPLTTTVMSSVGEEQAGVASGINNAVSRTAGLLAIAVFGVVMLHGFSQTDWRRMNEIQLDERVKH